VNISWWVTVLVRELQASRWELLLWEAGNWGRGQFGNPDEGERLPLEAATKQRQMEIVTDWEH
jgi:hypothetical protein